MDTVMIHGGHYEKVSIHDFLNEDNILHEILNGYELWKVIIS